MDRQQQHMSCCPYLCCEIPGREANTCPSIAAQSSFCSYVIGSLCSICSSGYSIMGVVHLRGCDGAAVPTGSLSSPVVSDSRETCSNTSTPRFELRLQGPGRRHSLHPPRRGSAGWKRSKLPSLQEDECCLECFSSNVV